MMDRKETITVMHVVGTMRRAGIETLLMEVMRRIDRVRFRFDFCCIEGVGPGAYAEEIRSLGGRIFFCDRSPVVTFPARMYRLLKRQRPSVVHCHVGWAAGLACMAGAFSGTRIRIAHAHNMRDSLWPGLKGRVRRKIGIGMARLFMTHGLACSADSGVFYLGSGTRNVRPFQVFINVVDIERIARAEPPTTMREELGLPPKALVVGNVGRLTYQKNQVFLLRIFREVLKRDASAYLILIGDGDDRAMLRKAAEEMGFMDRLVLTGYRNDVEDLISGTIDVLAFPSRYEGSTLVCIECQAACVPLVMSDRVPHEVVLIPELVRVLSLDESAEVWADTILEAAHMGKPDRDSVFRRLSGSELDVNGPYVSRLISIYESCSDT